MNILLFGPNGQVGRELQRSLSAVGNVISCDRHSVNLMELDGLSKTLKQHSPDMIVNAAAYTQVDHAESHEKEAHGINVLAPQCMADYAAKHDILLVHYSTDYVFDGTQQTPYLETDPVNPINVYGKTKVGGENAIRDSGARHLILRSSWIFSAHGRNFLKTILSLAQTKSQLNIVNDQIGAPTSAELIANVTATILKKISQKSDIEYGTYHLTASGQTSWFDFARCIVDIAEREDIPLSLTADQVHPIPSIDYPTPAKRPAFSIMNTKKCCDAFSIEFPQWYESVPAVIRHLKKEFS